MVIKHKHKYGAKRTKRDEHTFDSKLEARYYDFLRKQEKEGTVVFFLRQVPFHLPGGIRYLADFQVFWDDGEVSFIDVKGRDTPISSMKRKQVESIYPVDIEVISTISHPKALIRKAYD